MPWHPDEITLLGYSWIDGVFLLGKVAGAGGTPLAERSLSGTPIDASTYSASIRELCRDAPEKSRTNQVKGKVFGTCAANDGSTDLRRLLSRQVGDEPNLRAPADVLEAGQEFWLKCSETLRKLDLAVEWRGARR